MISFDRALGPHTEALALRSERTTILADNIANADTPQFKARDIDFRSALAAAEGRSGTVLDTTHSRHQQPTDMGASGERLYRNPTMPSLDGNTVDAHIEQTEFAENNMRFLASLRFVDGRFKSMLAAIKGE